ncbi:MAG TPA: TetR family transcriptional regulator [Actinocatenispora sp.]
MPHDSAATRTRLLDAAFTEFVERGPAGARVDRIAAQATANKQAIYAYFGSKDGLFDAVLTQRLGVLADVVPFRPDDLPAYALATFDFLLRNPQVMRLTLWKRLARPDATDAEAAAYREKAETLLATRPGLGTVERALDVLVLTLSMATTWAQTEPALLGGARTSRQRDHRRSLALAVRGAVDALATEP